MDDVDFKVLELKVENEKLIQPMKVDLEKTRVKMLD